MEKKNKFLWVTIVILGLLVWSLNKNMNYWKGVYGDSLEAQIELQSRYDLLLEATDQDRQLEVCLEEAETKFHRLFVLNSKPSQKNKDARTWDNRWIREQVDNEFERDRQFCLKRHQ